MAKKRPQTIEHAFTVEIDIDTAREMRREHNAELDSDDRVRWWQLRDMLGAEANVVAWLEDGADPLCGEDFVTWCLENADA